MSQNRTYDYAAANTSAIHNRRLIDLLPSGVYRGFKVFADGWIDPGVLFTVDGVRIEETFHVRTTYGDTWENTGVPAGDATHPRIDLVVCSYLYEASDPAPVAHYRVITGTPAASPVAPDMPEDAVLLATCTMPQAGASWSVVLQAGPPERLVNCVAVSGGHQVVYGDLAAFREVFDMNLGQWRMYQVPADTYEDGDDIVWPAPALAIVEDGSVAVQTLTVGDLQAASAMIDYRTVHPFEGWPDFSENYVWNGVYGGYWQSGEDAQYFYIPLSQHLIRQGASSVAEKLLSVRVYIDNNHASDQRQVSLSLWRYDKTPGTITPVGGSGSAIVSSDPVIIDAGDSDVIDLVCNTICDGSSLDGTEHFWVLRVMHSTIGEQTTTDGVRLRGATLAIERQAIV